jgi:hypothetical protein
MRDKSQSYSIRYYSILFSLFASIFVPQIIHAKESASLTTYGDFRARIEADTDSLKGNALERDDRTRLRIRLRVGANYQVNQHWGLGVRLRSGSNNSQQSPHITIKDFDDNAKGDSDVNIDKAFIKAKYRNVWFWVGKNANPMFKSNEIVWDDDVTVLGAAIGTNTSVNAVNLTYKAGYFSLPVGMQDSAGDMALLQAIASTSLNDIIFKAALTYLDINADQSDKDSLQLLDNNGSRDYNNWVIALQSKTKLKDKVFFFGFDYIVNTKNYSKQDPDPYTALNYKENNAWTASLRWGELKTAGDWQIRYDYAYVESLAVNNSYAQDDWVRWGNANQTRASNFKGSEFRFAYAISPKLNIVSRFYSVSAIKLRKNEDISKEDGNRFRIDLNWKF